MKITTGYVPRGARALLRRIRATAATEPDRPALVHADEVLTYRGLVAYVEEVAATLAGAPPDAVVAVAARREVWSLAKCLGVLDAGLTVFPYDAAQPPARAAAQRRAARVWATLGDPAAEPCFVPGPGIGPAAYILSTSGTTGDPKLVVVTDDDSVRYARGFLDRLGAGAGPINAMLLQPLCVDIGYSQVVASLFTGGTLYVLDEVEVRDPLSVRRYLAEYPIDLLKLTPSHLRALQQGDINAIMPRRFLVLGGEGCPPAYVRDLATANPHCAVFNHYGPSETGVGVAMQRAVPGAPLPATTTASLGTGLDGVTLTVGDRGELLIGDIEGGGYAGNPRETAARFVPATHSGAAPGSRTYRSGDVVELDDAGHIYFVERLDSQVKVRGYRIDLREVETVLRRMPGVIEAAAGVSANGQRVLAAVVGSASLDGAAIRAGLHDVLPVYMVPAAIAVVGELPRTPGGKIDRRGVKNVVPDGENAVLNTAAPDGGPLVGQILEIFAEALGDPTLTPESDFFSHGGDSLLAMTVVWQVQSETASDVSVADLVEARSAAALARVCRPLAS